MDNDKPDTWSAVAKMAYEDTLHPAYVELVKQMSSDEARIMKHFVKIEKCVPTISLRLKLPDHDGELDYVSWFTLLYKRVANLQGTDPKSVSVALNNLERLGLLVRANGRHLTDDALYLPLEQDEYIVTVKRNTRIGEGAQWVVDKSYVELTPLGLSFAGICIDDKKAN